MFNAKAHNRIQIHMIKTYAASNLNRDDLGAPKEVNFGGSRRLRVSSQSIKRSVRTSEVFDSFRAYATKEYNGANMVRTGLVAQLLRDRLSKPLDMTSTPVPEKVIAKAVRWIMEILGAKAVEKADKEKKEKEKEKAAKGSADESAENNGAEKSAEEKTQLVSFSERELDIIADAVRNVTDPKDVNTAIGQALEDRAKGNIKKLAGDYSVEAQLFGRMMTATEGFKGIDSPLQVAHAMTTHEISVQRDYWTGIDDVKVATNVAGSGMIDVRRFGAGTFYLYSCLDLDLLLSNIRTAFFGEEEKVIRAITRDTAIAWLQGMALSNPTGFQNSFAANDLPTTVAMEIGSSFPYSAAKAFEKPVEARSEEGRITGYESPSVDRLIEWDNNRHQTYGAYVKPLQGYGLNALSTHAGLEALVTKAGEDIDALFSGLDEVKAV